jgi:hypothetical protein
MPNYGDNLVSTNVRQEVAGIVSEQFPHLDSQRLLSVKDSSLCSCGNMNSCCARYITIWQRFSEQKNKQSNHKLPSKILASSIDKINHEQVCTDTSSENRNVWYLRGISCRSNAVYLLYISQIAAK